MKNHKNLNQALIETRKRRGLTQIAAANEMQVSLASIRNWEQGMPITAKKIPLIEAWIDKPVK